MNDMFMIRDYKAEDYNLVKSCFLKGLYYGDSWCSDIPKDIFMQNYSRFLDAMLISPNKVIRVACFKDDIDTVVGYSILSADQSIIHWVFVKTAWRNKGIGRNLLPANPKAVTHLTALGKSLLHKYKDCVFNPFAV